MNKDRGFTMPTQHFDASRMLNNSSDGHNASDGAARTPQYIIKCEDFFSSKIEGYSDDSSPCLWVEAGSARLATIDSSGELSGDGKTTATDTVVCMKYGSWGPLIQGYMWAGMLVKNISIYRFINVGATKEIVQELNYATCYIKKYRQEGDTIIFSFTFATVEDVSNAFNHDGTKAGKVAAKFDFGTLKVDVKS